MIKIVRIRPLVDAIVELTFSDGTTGNWSAADLIRRDTVLTAPLGDQRYFERAFIEAGSLAWPNGLEFSASALHRELDTAGTLIRTAA